MFLEIPMRDSKSRVCLPFQEKLSHSRTDPHKWRHCCRISLLHEITFWSAEGSKTDHFYSGELWVNLFVRGKATGFVWKHIEKHTGNCCRRWKYLTSKPRLHHGLKDVCVCVCDRELSVHIYFLPGSWMRHARVSSEISSLHCFSKSKIMDTLWEDS